MKIQKNLVHVLPLAAILGVSGVAIAGNTLINDSAKDSHAFDNKTISMAITGDFDLEITPEVGGTYAEKEINISVTTANAAGYNLYMESKNAITAVQNEDGEGIASVQNVVSKKSMPINSWGYYVGNSATVAPIPTNGDADMIASTDRPVSGHNTTVGVGVTVAPTLRSGDYENVLSFSAVPNEICEGFFCIDTMQEMTPEVCEATTTPYATAMDITYEYTTDRNYIPRTMLRDTRDGKTYLVSKYADGQCWMSQSLELELSDSVALTDADTDLKTIRSWTPDTSTTSDYSTNDSGGYHDKTARSFYPSVKYLRNGITPSDTPSTSDGTSEWEKVGIYYNAFALTAGQAFHDSSANSYFYDSICPKGWNLPDDDIIDDFLRTYSSALDSETNPLFSALGKQLAFNAAGDIDWNGNLDDLGIFSRYATSYIYDNYYQTYRVLEVTSQLATTSMDSMNTLQVRCVAKNTVGTEK